MKILMDARSLGKKPSGIGMYVNNMAQALLDHTTIEIVFVSDVCESGQMKNLEEQGIRVLCFGPVSGMKLLSYYRFVRKMILQEKPDVFWECNTLVPIKITNPYGRMWLTIHDMFPITDAASYSRLYPMYFKYGIRKSIRYFDRVIYNSEYTKEESEHYFKGIGKLESTVAYIPIPRLPETEITDNGAFLYIGNLEHRKGTDILLAAYREYRKKGGTRELRLAGKIREKEVGAMLDALVAEVSGVKYLGYVSEEEKYMEYASCHAFLFPSGAEGFGMPLIEVMNYGKPIITLQIPVLEEITEGSTVSVRKEELVSVMLADDFVPDTGTYAKCIERYSEANIVSILLSALAEDR